ncbi:MAG: fluoride exporter [Candidatus Eremiobacteraeota bacterium]|nr:fluoride exporter [Candidatus Eremiobacteraeota bacterium]
MMERRTIVAVACGAAAGGIVRLFVTQAMTARGGAPFGYDATLLVNLTGSLLLGMVIEVAQADTVFTPFWRIFLTTGLIGGYTTFSAFSFDTLELAARGFALTAVLYAAGSVTLGIAAVYLGIAAARATRAAVRSRSARRGQGPR